MIYTGLGFFMLGAKFAPVAKIFTSIQYIGGGDGGTDLMPMRFRGQSFGIISGMWAIGSASEPAIGGAFSQNASWVRCLNDGRNIESYQRATEMDLMDQLAIYWCHLFLFSS